MNNAEVLDVLALAHALIAAGWCKIWPVTNRRFRPVDGDDGQAARYCVVGALCAALREINRRDLPAEWFILDLAAVDLPTHPLYSAVGRLGLFNDRARRKRDVLRLLERAAARIGK